MFVQYCLKFFVLGFICLKIHAISKNDQFLVKKVKPLCKSSPDAIGTAFSAKFSLDARVQSSAFWVMSNLGLFCNSTATNLNFSE